MRDATRASRLHAACRRLLSSHDTIAASRNLLAHNDRVVESLTARHRSGEQDSVHGDSTTKLRRALRVIERVEASVWLAEQRLKIGEELVELSRQRVKRPIR